MKVPARAQEKMFRKTVRHDLQLQYLLYLPRKFRTKKRWPLVLFLHGAGERGSDLSLVKRHGPPKLAEAGKDLPYIVVAPQCPDGRWWNDQLESLQLLLDEICRRCPVDPDRIYVTGLSMGGYGTWALALSQPDRFAAIAPICGGSTPFLAPLIKHVPTWVFHGAKDGVVPITYSREMVESLRAAGGKPKFTVYPDAGHDSWTAAYADGQFWRWLLRQRRRQ
jgi:predicted peptidase